MNISKSDQKEINEVMLGLWAAVDQAQIMDLIEFAFKNLPYKLKKDVLKNLYDYAKYDSCKSGVIGDEELEKLLERAEEII